MSSHVFRFPFFDLHQMYFIKYKSWYHAYNNDSTWKFTHQFLWISFDKNKRIHDKSVGSNWMNVDYHAIVSDNTL